MKVTNDNLSVRNFDAWSGARDTKDLIIGNNKVDEFDFLIEELYPVGLTETQLNDFLWFEEVWICETLGIDNE